jgi:hypothetical protein
MTTPPPHPTPIWWDDLPRDLAIRLARATGATDEQIAAASSELDLAEAARQHLCHDHRADPASVARDTPDPEMTGFVHDAAHMYPDAPWGEVVVTGQATAWWQTRDWDREPQPTEDPAEWRAFFREVLGRDMPLNAEHEAQIQRFDAADLLTRDMWTNGPDGTSYLHGFDAGALAAERAGLSFPHLHQQRYHQRQVAEYAQRQRDLQERIRELTDGDFEVSSYCAYQAARDGTDLDLVVEEHRQGELFDARVELGLLPGQYEVTEDEVEAYWAARQLARAQPSDGTVVLNPGRPSPQVDAAADPGAAAGPGRIPRLRPGRQRDAGRVRFPGPSGDRAGEQLTSPGWTKWLLLGRQTGPSGQVTMIPAQPPACLGGCQRGRQPPCHGQYRELWEVSSTDQAIRGGGPQ